MACRRLHVYCSISFGLSGEPDDSKSLESIVFMFAERFIIRHTHTVHICYYVLQMIPDTCIVTIEKEMFTEISIYFGIYPLDQVINDRRDKISEKAYCAFDIFPNLYMIDVRQTFSVYVFLCFVCFLCNFSFILYSCYHFIMVK